MPGRGCGDPNRWTPAMRKAAAERMRARMAAMTPKQRAELQAKQAAGRAGSKAPRPKQAPRAKAEPAGPKDPSNIERIGKRARDLSCAGACPFLDEVVSRVAKALLAELPTGVDREAQRLAILALKMARTPSRDPRWFEAMTAVHRAATEWGQHHPAIQVQVDRAEA